MSNHISPELRGYISELQAQVSMFSDRAAGLSGQLLAARQANEELMAKNAGLEKELAGRKESEEPSPAAFAS